MAKFVFRNEDKKLAEFYDPDAVIYFVSDLSYLSIMGKVVIDYDDEQSDHIIRFHVDSKRPANVVCTLPVICPNEKTYMMIMSLLNNSPHEVIRRDIA